MIAVVVISMALASFLALFRPIDVVFQGQGRSIRVRIVAAAVIGLTVTAAYALGCTLVVQVVRRVIVLRWNLRKSPTEWRR